MKLRQLVVLACTLAAVSACIVAPYGGRGYGVGYHDYGRPVWRG
jgi:hypothetical protein